MLKELFFIGTRIGFLISAVFLLGGCASMKQTSPSRSATEQLLLSTSTDRALQYARLADFAHQKVFLDTTYFDSYDSKYAVGEIRDALSRAGALLVDNVTNSDITIEARSGALSIDGAETLIGVPTMGVPVPLAGALQIPELALYKAQKQYSTAKIALLAYATHSREHVYSSGSLVGKSYNKYHKILFIGWVATDVPENQNKPEKAESYQARFARSDLQNLPSTNSPATSLAPANITPTNNLPTMNTNAPSATNTPETSPKQR